MKSQAAVNGRPLSPFFAPAVCLLLVLLTAALYGQTIRFGFLALDDADYITDNRAVRGGLGAGSAAWALTAVHSANWHPVTWLSHMVDVQLFGLRPGGHHLTSVGFHLLNNLLLFIVLARMTRDPVKSAFVAVLFAIHPLNVETVAWLSQRKSLLSTFFGLAAIGFYARYAESKNPAPYLAALLLYLLSLMSKPMLVTLPFALLLLDRWPLGRWVSPDAPGMHTVGLLREKAPFFLLAAGASFITLMAQKGAGAMASLEAIPLPARTTNALTAYLGYMGKAIWPSRLTIYYPHPLHVAPWKALSALLAILLITAAVLRLRRGSPYLMFGWCWYLLTLVPVIGLVQVGSQAMADRYAYVPMIGLFVAAAWGIPELMRRIQLTAAPGKRPPVWLTAAVWVLPALLFATSWNQLGHWTDGATLFEHAVKVTPQSPRAHFNLGVELASVERMREAESHYRKALELRPTYAMAHNNLGMLLAGRGEARHAHDHFRTALDLDPDYAQAAYNLGNWMMADGSVPQAIAYYARAVELSPQDPEIHNNLGVALMHAGRFEAALFHFERALGIDPAASMVRGNRDRAVAEIKRGRPESDRTAGSVLTHPDPIPGRRRGR